MKPRIVNDGRNVVVVSTAIHSNTLTWALNVYLGNQGTSHKIVRKKAEKMARYNAEPVEEEVSIYHSDTQFGFINARQEYWNNSPKC